MSDQLRFDALATRIADLERRVRLLEAGIGGGAPDVAAPSFAPSGPDADPEVLDALRSGNTIGAIKRYRELTGLGLAEAKDAVEGLRGL
jgi:ribosomal protein L7/L12